MREEAGTPAIVGAIRAGLVFQLKQVHNNHLEALQTFIVMVNSWIGRLHCCYDDDQDNDDDDDEDVDIDVDVDDDVDDDADDDDDDDYDVDVDDDDDAEVAFISY